jgi:hypothetical protein
MTVRPPRLQQVDYSDKEAAHRALPPGMIDHHPGEFSVAQPGAPQLQKGAPPPYQPPPYNGPRPNYAPGEIEYHPGRRHPVAALHTVRPYALG